MQNYILLIFNESLFYVVDELNNLFFNPIILLNQNLSCLYLSEEFSPYLHYLLNLP
jgi:hypothetical protein